MLYFPFVVVCDTRIVVRDCNGLCLLPGVALWWYLYSVQIHSYARTADRYNVCCAPYMAVVCNDRFSLGGD